MYVERAHIIRRSRPCWRGRIMKVAPLLATRIATRSVDRLLFLRRWWWMIKSTITNMWAVAASRRRSSYSTSDVSLKNAAPMKAALPYQSSAINNERFPCRRLSRWNESRKYLTVTQTDTHTHINIRSQSFFSFFSLYTLAFYIICIYILLLRIVISCHFLFSSLMIFACWCPRPTRTRRRRTFHFGA